MMTETQKARLARYRKEKRCQCGRPQSFLSTLCEKCLEDRKAYARRKQGELIKKRAQIGLRCHPTRETKALPATHLFSYGAATRPVVTGN